MALHHMLRAAVQQQAAGPSDPYFEYNTLLLTGDGTNGAQNNTFLAANGAAQGPFADPAGYWSNYFDGNGDYLGLPTNSALSLSGDFTIDFFAYSPSTAQQQIWCPSSGVDRTISIVGDGTWGYWDGSTQRTFGAFQASTWAYITLTRTGSTMKGFLNGVQGFSITDTGTLEFSAGAIGYRQRTPSGYYFNGYISNFRIVKGTGVSSVAVPTTPLTAISGTSLLTCQSNVICDTSSNLFAITANGNAAVNNKSPFTISPTYNPYSFSGYFDGSGDYLDAGANAAFAFGTGAWTVEAWVYVTTLQEILVFDTRSSASIAGIGCRIDANGTLYYSGSANNSLTSTAITANTWNHIAWVYNGTTLTGYINGVSGGTATPSFNITQNNGVVGRVAFAASGYMLGYISNLRVVKGTAVYTGNFTPSNEPLTAISGTSLLTCQSATFVDNSPNAFTITVNGNTTVATASNSGLPVTRNGNTTQGTFSPYGSLWSNSFDGNDDYFSAATTLGSGDFTIEFWYYPNTLINGQSISGSYGSASTGHWLFYVNASLKIQIYNFSGLGGTFAVTPVLGQWNHICWTRSGSTNTFYLNGTSVATASNSTNWTGTGTLYVGSSGTGDGAYCANGYISNYRIVKGSAIAPPAGGPTTPLTAVSGTSLLTCQSNRFIDNSSNNFTLTVNGNTSVQRFSPFNPTAPYDAATIGGSGYFDGTGDYLTISGGVTNNGTGDLCFEFWSFYTGTYSAEAVAFDSRTSPFNNGFAITSAATSGYWTMNFTVQDILTSTPAAKNTWQHVALTRSGNTFRLFIDGVLRGTVSSSNNLTSTTNIIGAAYNAGGAWPGYMSNVRCIKGSIPTEYQTSSTTVGTVVFTPPTSPVTAVSGTSLLTNFTNAGIPDAAMMNDLETVGNAQVSTSVKKYGTGSLAFDGTGDGLSGPNTPNLQLASGNFTIEFWVNFSLVNNTARRLFVLQNGTANWDNYSYFMNLNASNVLVFNFASGTTLYPITGPTVIANTWYHVAIARSGTVTTMYVNGVSQGTVTLSTFNNITNGQFLIGIDIVGLFNLAGYIDDFRITKGYARYTANFTPPTAALPTY